MMVAMMVIRGCRCEAGPCCSRSGGRGAKPFSGHELLLLLLLLGLLDPHPDSAVVLHLLVAVREDAALAVRAVLAVALLPVVADLCLELAVRLERDARRGLVAAVLHQLLLGVREEAFRAVGALTTVLQG